MVIPVGLDSQKLIKITKHKGKLKQEDLGGFRFVPLTGKYGFRANEKETRERSEAE